MVDDITTISQVPEDYTLVTDSQEVQAVLEHIGESVDERVGLFVKTENAEYTEVLSFSGCVPYVHKTVRRLR